MPVNSSQSMNVNNSLWLIPIQSIGANQLMAVMQWKLFFGSELLSVNECTQIIVAHSNSAKVCQSINGNHAVEIIQWQSIIVN